MLSTIDDQRVGVAGPGGVDDQPIDLSALIARVVGLQTDRPLGLGVGWQLNVANLGIPSTIRPLNLKFETSRLNPKVIAAGVPEDPILIAGIFVNVGNRLFRSSGDIVHVTATTE